MKFRLVVTLALLFLVMIFAVQNASIVEIKLLFWHIDFPRWLLIFVMLVIGIVVGWFLRGMVRTIRKDKKRAAATKAE